MFVAGCLGKEKLDTAQGKMKKLYDRRVEFSPGDQVLALTPIAGSPLQAKFTGPFVVTEKLSDLNYLIATLERRKSTQLVHVNLIKSYYQRDSDVTASCTDCHPVLAVGFVPATHYGDGVPEPDVSLLSG